MNKPTMALFLSALVALVASPLAVAQSTTAAADNSMHALQDGQTQAPTAPANQGPPKPGDRTCLQSTGSMIPAKHGGCLTVPGRSYNRQDILNTGETTMGPALQKLDPSVTIQGGH